MKYYIPKYVPIYKSNNKICIGFANKLDRYVEFDYTDDNYNYIEKILVEGTTEITDSSPEILKNLFESNLIELQKVEVYTQRGYLFLEYLKNGNFPLVKDSEILVFGAGGVGGTLIYLLAQFGFTNLHIVDFDEVNDSDVFKLLVYDKEQIGIRKVKALQEKIEKNFGFKINTYESELVEFAHLNQLISAIEPALIVKACDPDLVFRVALNKICYDQKIPHLHIAYSFEDIRIGPLFIPGFMGCDQCLNLSMQEIYGSHYAFENNKRLFSKLQIHPSVSFNINIAASFVLKEIIFFLTQQIEFCFSIGRIVELNPLSLQFSHFDIKKNIGCTVCSDYL